MSEPDLRDPRLDGAYRETPREEPPPALDERIRAAARRAVDARPQSLSARRSWASRWRIPLSIAATVVVAVTLSFMVQDEEARKSRVDTPISSPVPQTAPAMREMEAKQPEPTPAPPATIQKRQADAEARGRADEVSPAPATPAQEAIKPAPSAPAATAGAAPAPFVREEQLRSMPDTEAAPGLSRDRALSDRPVGATREAVPARAPAAPAAVPAQRPPEAWLEEIRRLKAQGREAEAAAELAEFRRRYPDFALPADLSAKR
jgi:hypothetical protein